MNTETLPLPTQEQVDEVVARHNITSLRSPEYSAAVQELLGEADGLHLRQSIIKVLYAHVRDMESAESTSIKEDSQEAAAV